MGSRTRTVKARLSSRMASTCFLVAVSLVLTKLSGVSTSTDDGPCLTDDSLPCVFPFKIASVEYNACTTRLSPKGRPWCRIFNIDGKTKHEVSRSWGYCSRSCNDLLSTHCYPVTDNCSCNQGVYQVCREVDKHGQMVSEFCKVWKEERKRNITDVSLETPGMCDISCRQCIMDKLKPSDGQLLELPSFLVWLCPDSHTNCFIFFILTIVMLKLCIVLIILLVKSSRQTPPAKSPRLKSIQPGDFYYD